MRPEQSPELPIYAVLADLRLALSKAPTVILEAPPGSGKSTIVPWELLNEDWLAGKKIIMMEPRRLAAKAVAARMAHLLGEPLGKRFGYRIRFDSRVSSDTRIEVVTEGILTRQLQRDNALDGVGLVIFDEFHERSLASDLALVLVRQSQQLLREDLRVLIMSATIESAALATLLGDAPIIKAEGRQYPLVYHYAASDPARTLVQNVTSLITRARREAQGDILVFLPGAAEIHKTQDLLGNPENTIVHALYGDLPAQTQQAAIEPDPSGRRKIVLATSIAETSLTIEGVSVVVDSGYSRVSKFDPRSGLSRLETVRITKDAADQRAGRAGRLGPGVAFRLWPEAANHSLLPARVPEILEADLAPMALELANWGITDLTELEWVTPPPAGNFAQACELLRSLEAITVEGKITDKGKAMLRLPTHPRIAHMLLEAKEFGLLSLGTDLAALLEERDPMEKNSGTDIGLRIETLRRARSARRTTGAFERIERIAANWRREFDVREDNGFYNEHDIGRLVAAAYPERIARSVERNARYRLANGRSARLPDHDPLQNEEWIAIASMDAGLKEGRIYSAAPLDVNDIASLVTERSVVEWDDRSGQLVAHVERRFGEITIGTKPLLEIPTDLRQQVVLDAIRKGGMQMLPVSDGLNAWRDRVSSLRLWRPELKLPDVSDQALFNTMEIWLAPYLTEIRRKSDLAKLDVDSYVRAMIDWQTLQTLNRLAPESIEVPSGSQIKLEYFDDARPPVLAVRLQEVFGLLDTPTVNDGTTKVLLHLLSPGYKPVQVTQDLRSFWQNAYPEIRKELRVRYQKHSWPEDPWTATAVRGAKKRSR